MASDNLEAGPSVMRRQEDKGALQARWSGVQETKARLKRMVQMQREEVGFRLTEEFVGGLENAAVCKRGQGRVERKIIHLAMRKKIEDEKGKLRVWKREKEKLRALEKLRLGGPRSNRYRRRMRTLHRGAKRANMTSK